MLTSQLPPPLRGWSTSFPEKTLKSQTSSLGNSSIELVEQACRIILDEHRRIVANQIGTHDLKLSSGGLHRETDRRCASMSFLNEDSVDANSPHNFIHSPSSVCGAASVQNKIQTQNQEAAAKTSNSEKTTIRSVVFDSEKVSVASSLPAECIDDLEFQEWSKRLHGNFFATLTEQTPVVYPKVVAKTVHAFAMASGWVGYHASALGPASMKTISVHSLKSARIVKDGGFDSMCALVILLNAILMGVAVNYAAANNIGRDIDMPIVFIISDYTFTAWFLIELILRILADGPSKYLSIVEPGAPWNYFDLVVVLMNVIGTVAALISEEGGGADLTSLRVVRMLRVAKTLRLFRLVRFFRALRKMVLSVLGSFTALLWALVLLMIMICVFGLFLTEQVTKHIYSDADNPGEVRDFDTLKRYFGSLGLAQYTLFLSVSGGLSWEEVSDALFRIHVSIGFSFCFYIFFTMFAMLNIITGIFVDIAISAAQGDKDECIAEQLHSRDSAVQQMQRLFEEVDNDGSGVINEEEFNALLTNPHMAAHLASLGMDVGGAEGLFRLLDLDNSGSITPEEFLVGCMRMKGNAKALDVVTLMYENKRMSDRWGKFMRYVADQFKARHEFEKRFVMLMKDVIVSIRTSKNSEDAKEFLWL